MLLAGIGCSTAPDLSNQRLLWGSSDLSLGSRCWLQLALWRRHGGGREEDGALRLSVYPEKWDHIRAEPTWEVLATLWRSHPEIGRLHGPTWVDSPPSLGLGLDYLLESKPVRAAWDSNWWITLSQQPFVLHSQSTWAGWVAGAVCCRSSV